MIVLSIMLFTCVFLLNTTTKLLVCSLAFTLSALVANVITELYGKSNAINILMLCILINIALVWKSLNFMLLASFISLLTSLYLSIYLFEKFKSILKFQAGNFISLVTCSLIDSSMIAISLLNKIPLNRVLIIGLKDFIFKLSYASIISLCLLMALSLLQRIRHNHWRANKLIDFIIKH